MRSGSPPQGRVRNSLISNIAYKDILKTNSNLSTIFENVLTHISCNHSPIPQNVNSRSRVKQLLSNLFLNRNFRSPTNKANDVPSCLKFVNFWLFTGPQHCDVSPINPKHRIVHEHQLQSPAGLFRRFTVFIVYIHRNINGSTIYKWTIKMLGSGERWS